MYRDSQATYVHLRSSHHVLHISDWIHDELPFDDIEAPSLNIDEENDLSDIQDTAFGASKAHKKSREPVWKDLDLNKFINDEKGYSCTGAFVEDKTILKKWDKGDDFLNNISSRSTDNSIIEDTTDSSSSFSSFAGNNPVPNFEITTPSVTRTITPVRNGLQTPVARIMR